MCAQLDSPQTNGARAGAVPQTATLIGAVASPPLSEIIRGLLKFSNNITAEAIGTTAMQRLSGHQLAPGESAAILTGWLENQT